LAIFATVLIYISKFSLYDIALLMGIMEDQRSFHICILRGWEGGEGRRVTICDPPWD